MSEWISVDNTLPKKAETVLFVIDGSIFFGYFWEDHWIEDACYVDSGEGTMADFEEIPADKVTHWMKLPDPPCKTE